jgi:hypothetical protein
MTKNKKTKGKKQMSSSQNEWMSAGGCRLRTCAKRCKNGKSFSKRKRTAGNKL